MAPPPRLLVVPGALRFFWFLPLLDDALWMFAAGWFCLGCFEDLTSGRIG
jgi:hypothetical protein